MFTIQQGTVQRNPDLLFNLHDGAQFKITRTPGGFQTTYLLCLETVSKMVITPFNNIEECYKQLKKYQTQGHNANGRIS